MKHVLSAIVGSVVILTQIAATGHAGERIGIRRAAAPRRGHFIVGIKNTAELQLAREQRTTAALRTSVTTQANAIMGTKARRIEYVYGSTVLGFAAKLSAKGAQQLSEDPRVAYVAEDGIVELSQSADETPCLAQTSTPSWGLDRIDQVAMPLDDSFMHRSRGANIDIYVVDTGILAEHTDFSGRASNVFSVDRSVSDCNGHGTHVAAIAAGDTYGVAKASRVLGVKVFKKCKDETSVSQVIAGLEWIAANAQRPAVVNLSLGGKTHEALDESVRALVRAGFVTVVAAGNDSADVWGASPARVEEAIVVGASELSGGGEGAAWYSNFGSTVDLYAPGSDITSAWNDGPTAEATLSGTSMAAPHVSGAAAAFLEDNPEADPAQVEAELVGRATTDVLNGVPTWTPNRLLYAGCPRCGDGQVNTAGEQCDPGDRTDGDGCDRNCNLEQCGNWSTTGYLQTNEQCEVGHSSCQFGCANCHCAADTCGNGIMGPGEECEPSTYNPCAHGCSGCRCQAPPPPPPPVGQCQVVCCKHPGGGGYPVVYETQAWCEQFFHPVCEGSTWGGIDAKFWNGQLLYDRACS